MTTWIALLRGINVGSSNRITMQALRNSLTSAGFDRVRTHIQSGNIVLDGRQRTTSATSRRVRDCLLHDFGLDVPVVVLSQRELDSVVLCNPFPSADNQPKTLHVWFLSGSPSTDWHKTLKRLAAANERVELVGQALYLHAPDGIGKSKLARGMEAAIGCDATARNWRTVIAMQELAQNQPSS